MPRLTIAEVEALPIRGSYYEDRVLLDAADRIAMDPEAPISERIRALRVIDKAQGIEFDEVDEADVENYVRENS